jgi:hypothetical protein
MGLLVSYWVYRIRLNIAREKIQKEFENCYISSQDLNNLTLIDDAEFSMIIFSGVVWYVAIAVIIIWYLNGLLVKFMNKKNQDAVKSLTKDLEEKYPEKFI